MSIIDQIRQVAAAQKQQREQEAYPYSFFCPKCLKQRFFAFDHEQGNKEYYRCTYPGCGRVIDFTVR